jgi:hypothetical protein
MDYFDFLDKLRSLLLQAKRELEPDDYETFLEEAENILYEE